MCGCLGETGLDFMTEQCRGGGQLQESSNSNSISSDDGKGRNDTTSSSEGNRSRKHSRASGKGNTMMLWTLRKLVALVVIVMRLAAIVGTIILNYALHYFTSLAHTCLDLTGLNLASHHHFR